MDETICIDPRKIAEKKIVLHPRYEEWKKKGALFGIKLSGKYKKCNCVYETIDGDHEEFFTIVSDQITNLDGWYKDLVFYPVIKYIKTLENEKLMHLDYIQKE